MVAYNLYGIITAVFYRFYSRYTVLGNAVKEDIILLEQQERNEFSYKLRGAGLKFKKVGNSVVAYKDSYKKPEFRLTAPVMVDSIGNSSADIKVKFDGKTNNYWNRDEILYCKRIAREPNN